MPVDRVVCAGGIAEKNPLLMQIYADVIGCTMQVAGSSQTCALGSAISAAVLAGAHPDFAAAEQAMTSLAPSQLRAGRRRIARSTTSSTCSIANCTTVSAGSTKSIDLSRFMKALIEIKYAEHA